MIDQTDPIEPGDLIRVATGRRHVFHSPLRHLPSERGGVMGDAMNRILREAEKRVALKRAQRKLSEAAPDLLSIARMAADGTYIPPQHARDVLERHGLVPGKDER